MEDVTKTPAHPAEDIQSSMDAASEGASQTFDVLAPAATQTADSTHAADISMLEESSINTVYLMGSSFIVGVLFTVFILLVLDFMRRNSTDDDEKKSS